MGYAKKVPFFNGLLSTGGGFHGFDDGGGAVFDVQVLQDVGHMFFHGAGAEMEGDAEGFEGVVIEIEFVDIFWPLFVIRVAKIGISTH